MSRKSSEEAEDERLRQSKLEEALEIQSLRRIICAYINYGDAAEEDVRRYEQSFRKLPPRHKALLSHYPRKFKSLRRCVSANTDFIYSMLQTFEPPFDMSEDQDTHEHTHMETAHNECPCSDISNGGFCPSGTATVSSCPTRASCAKKNSSNCNNPEDIAKHEVQGAENSALSVAGDCCGRLQGEETNMNFDCDSCKVDTRASVHELHSNGNVSS
ncbi:unnamed protein product [Rhodiola kirilowii]